jgi:hypothetical protein
MAHPYSFKVPVEDLHLRPRAEFQIAGTAVENRVSSGKKPPYPDGLTGLQRQDRQIESVTLVSPVEPVATLDSRLISTHASACILLQPNFQHTSQIGADYC